MEGYFNMKLEKGQIVMHILTGERVMIIDVCSFNIPEYKIRTCTYQEIDVKEFELQELELEEGE